MPALPLSINIGSALASGDGEPVRNAMQKIMDAAAALEALARTRVDFFSFADLAATTVSALQTVIVVSYPHGTMYLQRTAAPTHPGWRQDASGAKFQYVAGTIIPELVGITGVGDETAKFPLLAQVMNAVGNPVVRFKKGQTYTIFSDAPTRVATDVLLNLANLRDWVVNFNGAKLQVGDTATNWTSNYVFLMDTCPYGKITDYNCVSPQQSVSLWQTNGNLFRGVGNHFAIQNDTHHLSIDGYIEGGINGVYFIRTIGSASPRAHDCEIDLRTKELFYPCTLAASGDGSKIKIDATNVGRTCFPQDVENIELDITLRGKSVISPTIDLTTYYSTLENTKLAHLKLTVRALQTDVSGYMIGLAAIPADPTAGRNGQGATIDDVDIVIYDEDTGYGQGLLSTWSYASSSHTANPAATIVYGEPEFGSNMQGIRIKHVLIGSKSATGGGHYADIGLARLGFGSRSLLDVRFVNSFLPSNLPDLYVGPYARVLLDACYMPFTARKWEDPLVLTLTGLVGTFLGGEGVTNGSGASGTMAYGMIGVTSPLIDFDGNYVVLGEGTLVDNFVVGQTITGGTSGAHATISARSIGTGGTNRFLSRMLMSQPDMAGVALTGLAYTSPIAAWADAVSAYSFYANHGYSLWDDSVSPAVLAGDIVPDGLSVHYRAYGGRSLRFDSPVQFGAGTPFSTLGYPFQVSGGVLYGGLSLGGLPPAGRWFNGLFMQMIYTGTGLALFADSMYVIPYLVPDATTFVRIAVNVTVAGAATKTARLGIYNWANGVPTTLVLDCGTVPVDVTGLQQIVINKLLPPGVYGLVVSSNGSPTIAGNALNQPLAFATIGQDDASITGNTGGVTLTRSLAGSSAALPASFGAVTTATGTSPMIFMRR